MEAETIFVQTDPAFDIVLWAIKELRDRNRLRLRHCQRAHIDNIASNHEQDDQALFFGGQIPAMGNKQFGRTASSIIRMCMLEAVGIRQDWWPKIGIHTNSRNRAALEMEDIMVPRFHLANAQEIAKNYWSKYDQLYPHSLIENKVDGLANNQQGSMPSMMFIFRRNFTEVIEITTTFNATPQGNQTFSSYVSVTCIVRDILEGEDGPHTNQLRAFMQPLNNRDQYFQEVLNIRNVEGAENLRNPLEIEHNEENEEDDEEQNEEEHVEENQEEHEEDNEANADLNNLSANLANLTVDRYKNQ